LTRKTVLSTVRALAQGREDDGVVQNRGLKMSRYLLAGVSLFAVAMSVGPVLAADMPVKAVYKAVPVEVFSWSGFYIGAHGGGGWARIDSTTVDQTVTIPGPGPVVVGALPVSTNLSGGLAGGQAGFNFQTGMWVWGVEAQGSWANLTGSTACTVVAAGIGAVSTACTGNAKVDALGTIAARLGVAVDRVLFYAKGGAAWAHNQYSTNVTVPGLGLAGAIFSANETRWGWMTGIGVEYAFSQNWSAKIEYNYMDLGTVRAHFTSPVTAFTSDVDNRERINVVKVGINYRFGGPVIARY
jgi:outer membrane immunogenic protein